MIRLPVWLGLAVFLASFLTIGCSKPPSPPSPASNAPIAGPQAADSDPDKSTDAALGKSRITNSNAAVKADSVDSQPQPAQDSQEDKSAQADRKDPTAPKNGATDEPTDADGKAAPDAQSPSPKDSDSPAKPANPANSASKPPPPMNDLISQADGHFHAGRYDEAAAIFQQAIDHYPGQPIPRLAYGHTMFALERYEDSAKSLRKGIQLDPQWVQVDLPLPGFFTEPNEFSQKLGRLDKHVAKNPKDEHALFLLAYCYHFSDQQAKARKLFEQLKKLAPKHVEAEWFLRPPPDLKEIN